MLLSHFLRSLKLMKPEKVYRVQKLGVSFSRYERLYLNERRNDSTFYSVFAGACSFCVRYPGDQVINI